MQLSEFRVAWFQAEAGVAVSTFVIGALLMVAFLVSVYAGHIAGWLVALNRMMPGRRRQGEQRERTLRQLYASLITIMAFVLAGIFVLRIFIDPAQIIWIIGLFSAAFGLGARSLVSDVVAGATYIFRNTFAIGEKAEFIVGMTQVEGVVEDVTMRATLVRAPSGELYTVPNGEITVIRNFTRGSASTASLRVRVPTEQLAAAVRTLTAVGEQAMALFPDQLEPWQVLMVDDHVGRKSEITIHARFRFGAAASAKPRLAALIYEGLQGAGLTVEE